MPRSQEDWSDSEDEQDSFDEEGYTSVHLGVPSDEIDVEEDILDPYVSRIGGTPAFLGYPHPSPDSSKCKICKEPSELLVQMLCNLEESPFERVLYIWGCSKSTCQRKDGAVRAWRGLKLDEKYAKKLERKKERKLQEEAAKKAKLTSAASKASSNPFSSGGPNPFSATASTPGFGFGDAIMGFGNETSTESAQAEPTKSPKHGAQDDDEGDESSSEEESTSAVDTLSSRLEKTSFGPSVDWNTLPHYKPIYLETESEYLPPPPKPKASGKAQVETISKGGGGDEWGKEMWEDSQNVDDVFVRFTIRVDANPKQCIRYELNGAPLFYQAESVFKALHSIPPGTAIPVTGAAFAVSNPAQKRSFNPGSSPLLGKCSTCGSARRFECQLMPNLINKLKRPVTSKGTDSQMEWGTCLIFTCEKDCCLIKEGEKEMQLNECWREEAVLVQWEE